MTQAHNRLEATRKAPRLTRNVRRTQQHMGSTTVAGEPS